MSLYCHVKAKLNKYYQQYTGLCQWLLLFLFGGWVIYVDPYGIGSVGERKSEEVIYRLSAGSYDASKTQSEILVVLFNDRAIANLYPQIWQSNDWPLSYLDQTNLLTTIMAQSPKAVFYDVMWMKQRSLDDTFEKAVEKLNITQQLTGVPLLMARGSYDSSMTEEMGDTLQSFSQLAINSWQNNGEQYPLFVNQQPTAAMLLYQEYCKQHECIEFTPETGYPVSVRWNSQAAPILLTNRAQTCENPAPNLLSYSIDIINSILHNIVPSFTPKNTPVLCPSQRVLYADEVMALARSPLKADRDKLKKWVQQSIVMVGGQIDGIYDYVVSPVHGAVPGVFFHAMALDNLIVYGNAYTKSVPFIQELNLLTWSIFILLLVAIKRGPASNKWIFYLQTHLWLMSFVYIILMLSLLYFIFHASPSGWISLLTLGWIGVKILEKLEPYTSQERR